MVQFDFKVTHTDAGARRGIMTTAHGVVETPAFMPVGTQGGLHKFIGWSKPILTDSGGYQVFSMAARRTLDEQGAHFRSHLDGSAHLLTPEKAADIQARLGSDIAMVLDECLAHPASDDQMRASMSR